MDVVALVSLIFQGLSFLKESIRKYTGHLEKKAKRTQEEEESLRTVRELDAKLKETESSLLELAEKLKEISILPNFILELNEFQRKTQMIFKEKSYVVSEVRNAVMEGNWGTAEEAWDTITRGQNSTYLDIKKTFEHSTYLKDLKELNNGCERIFLCENEIRRLLEQKKSGKTGEIVKKIIQFFNDFSVVNADINEFLKKQLKENSRITSSLEHELARLRKRVVRGFST